MAMVRYADYFGARISSRVDLTIISTIIGKLSTKNKSRFKDSCFGQFMELEDMQFQGQLYLHLLFKQDGAHVRNTLVFHINNMDAEFGPKEFSLITGLQFGEIGSIPAHSKLHKKAFKNKTIINLQDVESAFLKAVQDGKDDLSLKLALLWVLYGLLLVRGHASRKIDPQYIHLANDLEAFNEFPWGRIAYEVLLTGFRSTIEHKIVGTKGKTKGKRARETRCQIDVHGFGFALQMWAYEAIPCVAKLCVIQKSNSLIPRMLRWKSNGVIKFDELTTSCFPKMSPGDVSSKKMHVVETLMASKAELKIAFYKSVVNWEQFDAAPSSSKHVNKRRRFNVGSCSKDEEGEGMMKKKNDMEDQEAAWRRYVMEQFQTINDKQSRIETLMMSVMDKLGKEGASPKPCFHESKDNEEAATPTASFDGAKGNEEATSPLASFDGAKGNEEAASPLPSFDGAKGNEESASSLASFDGAKDNEDISSVEVNLMNQIICFDNKMTAFEE